MSFMKLKIKILITIIAEIIWTKWTKIIIIKPLITIIIQLKDGIMAESEVLPQDPESQVIKVTKKRINRQITMPTIRDPHLIKITRIPNSLRNPHPIIPWQRKKFLKINIKIKINMTRNLEIKVQEVKAAIVIITMEKDLIIIMHSITKKIILMPLTPKEIFTQQRIKIILSTLILEAKESQTRIITYCQHQQIKIQIIIDTMILKLKNHNNTRKIIIHRKVRQTDNLIAVKQNYLRVKVYRMTIFKR